MTQPSMQALIARTQRATQQKAAQREAEDARVIRVLWTVIRVLWTVIRRYIDTLEMLAYNEELLREHVPMSGDPDADDEFMAVCRLQWQIEHAQLERDVAMMRTALRENRATATSKGWEIDEAGRRARHVAQDLATEW